MEGKKITIGNKQLALLALSNFISHFEIETIKSTNIYKSDYDVEFQGIKFELSVRVIFDNCEAKKFEYALYANQDSVIEVYDHEKSSTLKNLILERINEYLENYAIDFDVIELEQEYEYELELVS